MVISEELGNEEPPSEWEIPAPKTLSKTLLLAKTRICELDLAALPGPGGFQL